MADFVRNGKPNRAARDTSSLDGLILSLLGTLRAATRNLGLTIPIREGLNLAIAMGGFRTLRDAARPSGA